jgi:hypothetical protein
MISDCDKAFIDYLTGIDDFSNQNVFQQIINIYTIIINEKCFVEKYPEENRLTMRCILVKEVERKK